MPAPIAIFAFNRPDHLRRTLEALAANELAAESHVTFFCDGPRTAEEKIKTDTVRAIARAAQGFASVEVVERAQNMGCAASVIDGLTHMFAKHGRLIVIEDDIVTSPYTLRYLNDGLIFYENKKTVFSISGWSPSANGLKIPHNYSYDVYATHRFNCWGWASWRDRFQYIDWNVSDYETFKKSKILQQAYNIGGDDLSYMLHLQMRKKIDSWFIRADFSRFHFGQISIHPIFSYVTNIGMGSGKHCTKMTTKYDNDITKAKQNIQFIDIIFCDIQIEKLSKKFWNFSFMTIIKQKIPEQIKIYIKNYLQIKD